MKTVFLTLFCICIISLSACSSNGSKTTNTTNPGKESTQPSKTNEQPPLIGTKWQLIELMGQPVNENGIEKSGYLFIEADSKFSASAGCNKFLGVFELNTEMMRIEFKTNMAATLMACPDEQKENNFKEMLAKVNTYTISESKLSLSKNKTAPFARFEAVNK